MIIDEHCKTVVSILDIEKSKDLLKFLKFIKGKLN